MFRIRNALHTASKPEPLANSFYSAEPVADSDVAVFFYAFFRLLTPSWQLYFAWWRPWQHSSQAPYLPRGCSRCGLRRWSLLLCLSFSDVDSGFLAAVFNVRRHFW